MTNNKVHLQALPGEVTTLSSLTFLLHFSILHKSKSATFRCPVSSLNMLLLSYTMGIESLLTNQVFKALHGGVQKKKQAIFIEKNITTEYSRRLKVTMDDSLRFMLMQVIHSSVTIHKGTQVRFSYFITTKHS